MDGPRARRYGHRLTRALFAEAEDFDDVCGGCEAVAVGDPVGPAFDLRGVDLDRKATGPADQMMVVSVGTAYPVERLPVAGLDHVDVP